MVDIFFFFHEKTFNAFVLLVLKKNELFLRYNLQIPNSMNMDELSLQIHDPAPETSANRCSAFERNYYKGIHKRVEYVLIFSYAKKKLCEIHCLCKDVDLSVPA